MRQLTAGDRLHDRLDSPVPLLEHHDTRSDNRPFPQRFICKERQVVFHTNHESALETVVLILGVLLPRPRLLELSERFDLQKLNAHFHIFGRGVAESGNCLKTFFFAASVHQVAGTLGHKEKHAGHKDQSGQ